MITHLSLATYVPVIASIVLVLVSGFITKAFEQTVENSVRIRYALMRRFKGEPLLEEGEKGISNQGIVMVNASLQTQEISEAAKAGYLPPSGVAAIAGDTLERATFVLRESAEIS